MADTALGIDAASFLKLVEKQHGKNRKFADYQVH